MSFRESTLTFETLLFLFERKITFWCSALDFSKEMQNCARPLAPLGRPDRAGDGGVRSTMRATSTFELPPGRRDPGVTRPSGTGPFQPQTNSQTKTLIPKLAGLVALVGQQAAALKPTAEVNTHVVRRGRGPPKTPAFILRPRSQQLHGLPKVTGRDDPARVKNSPPQPPPPPPPPPLWR